MYQIDFLLVILITEDLRSGVLSQSCPHSSLSLGGICKLHNGSLLLNSERFVDLQLNDIQAVTDDI